jgi:hypothetical protein
MGMWDKVVIGDGRTACSALKVFEIEGDHHISQDSVSYWIGDIYLGEGMTIFKNTPAGEGLTEMIRQGANLIEINLYLKDLFLRHIDPSILRKLIDRALAEARKDGEKSKAREIRAALNIF